jgi:putative transposase
LVVVVHAAHIQDRDGARLVLQQMRQGWSRLQLFGAEGGYTGPLLDWVVNLGRRRRLEIVKRNADTTGFKVLPKRWIVERTFAWLGRYRRHSKDYEMLPEGSEAMIRISMINLMLHRLAPG